MTQPEGINVLPGMTVSVTAYPLAGADSEQRLVVPARAVLSRRQTGSRVVWVDRRGDLAGAPPRGQRRLDHRRRRDRDPEPVSRVVSGSPRPVINQLREEMEIRLLGEKLREANQ